MSMTASFTEETGLEVFDLRDDAEFASRTLHPRDAARQMSGLQRLSRAFVENPNTILQELVNIAIDLCEADSAGISIEKADGTDENFYQWIAAAGGLRILLQRHAAALSQRLRHLPRTWRGPALPCRQAFL